MAEKYQQSVEKFINENGHELITFAITILMAILSAIVDFWDILKIFKQGTYNTQLKALANSFRVSGNSEQGNKCSCS